MDYREITKRDMEYQKKLLEEYQSRLGALPPGRLETQARETKPNIIMSAAGRFTQAAATENLLKG